MANQLAIAKALGLTQATVSRALHNHPLIADKTRRLVQATAKKMGYIPNPMVVSLMQTIRSGRPSSDHGCLAILIRSRPTERSFDNTFERQYAGMVRRAELRGFRAEFFYLSDYGMDPKRIDKVLRARGITGIILAPTQAPTDPVAINWSRYACATISYTWPMVHVDRASINHRSQIDGSFRELLRRQYKRIGLCLPPLAVDGVDGAWMDRYLYWKFKLKNKQPLPLLVGRPGELPLSEFRRWYNRWKPDAIIGLVGHEKEWLDQLKLRCPDDIGYVCVNRPSHGNFSGMDENHEIVGATAADLVIQRILSNEYGLPEHPRLILLDGVWVEGDTLRKINS